MIDYQYACDRVLYWQRTLAILGISTWRIEVTVVTTPFGQIDTDAVMQCAADYDHAYMQIRQGWLDDEDTSNRDLDETVVHELLHIAMRDFDGAIEAIDEQLAPAVKELWEHDVTHEREGLIDRLALLIVSFHDGDGFEVVPFQP